jgi:hypothetical protein
LRKHDDFNPRLGLRRWIDDYDFVGTGRSPLPHKAEGHPDGGCAAGWRTADGSLLIEPPRVCRMPFGLSYAAIAGCSSMA